MAAPIRLQRTQLADLKLIAGLSADELQAVVDHLRSVERPPLHAKQLRQQIAGILPSKPTAVAAIMRQLLGLHGLIGETRLSVDAVFGGLSTAVQTAKPKWSDNDVQAWRARAPLLQQLLSLDAVRIVAKALDLSYEYANLLRIGRIITDVRPVFTLDAKAIDAAVISHKLFIRYDNIEGLKTFTMTLDEEDLKTLRSECDRALQKAETLATQLTTGTPVRTIIPGREDND